MLLYKYHVNTHNRLVYDELLLGSQSSLGGDCTQHVDLRSKNAL